MIQELYQRFLDSKGAHTDTRSLEKGHFFIALKGERFDANEYVQQALDLGAHHVVTSDSQWQDQDKVTVVPNTLESLQQLATHHRNALGIPVVALTGSNGKTTTKELICAVLATEFNVTGTRGNLNNHIGVPLTLLSMNKSTQIGIVEMGANHQGEIAALAEIAQPDFGLITNYGKAHLEGFGGVDGIKKGKSELYEYLKESDGTAIVGRWDPEQIVRSAGIKQIFTPQSAQLHTEIDPILFTIDGLLIRTQLTGTYNYHNAVFAYTVGKTLGVSSENLKKGIASYQPSNNRSQIIEIGKTKIILDAYNANPSSMKVALENLSRQSTKHRVAILGDMFELGIYAKEEHQEIAAYANKLGIDEIHLVGENFMEIGGKFKTHKDLSQSWSLNPTKEQVILIKGSRGMTLEQLLKEWT
ncbi:UDP-N-acetylmuramoyl-tripeptide--D-alanyl-D-alanine ligase [Nonlabens xiamenensis]|uniref:UDP-N-acetylmuramoyl-tripeptide--D-alanyl-D- alanine ligase n=1 Tax=Nonlabens xiamenensis TaxID=2341043 RepID=UPI000F60C6AC|nr:UDP-N-acetylmuramoyl-tripeptide--D-alanyl-D-alanine ligase [Nonlabens xiamenensis]